MPRAATKKRKKGNTPLVGCLFWLFLILLVVGLFLLNRERVSQALEKMNFWQKVFPQQGPGSQGPGAVPQKQPDALQNPSPEAQKKDPTALSPEGQAGKGGSQTPGETGPASPKTGPSASEKTPSPSDGAKQKGTPTPVENPPAAKLPSAGTGESGPAKQSPATSPEKGPSATGVSPKGTSPAVSPEKPAPKIRRIYLVRVEEDGTVARVPVERSLPSSDTPLADAIASLLKGPTATEKQKGYTSLIPPGTRLYSALVKDGIAYLNFSEEFLFSPYGTEGYLGQLKQIVWTATEFPTVKQVQILIEGKVTEYLGEGIRIGRPLSRDSF
ncbi:MAG: GerMN domain-containing protein [Treponemataceae bacterium]|nr:GerMN domain-containing protein [Treponemataceae bacterium]